MKHPKKKKHTPGEVPSLLGGELYAELIGDGNLTLEGFGKLDAYSSDTVRFLLRDGRRFSIGGEDLTVSVIRRDVFALHGKIVRLEFEQNDGAFSERDTEAESEC